MHDGTVELMGFGCEQIELHAGDPLVGHFHAYFQSWPPQARI